MLPPLEPCSTSCGWSRYHGAVLDPLCKVMRRWTKQCAATVVVEVKPNAKVSLATARVCQSPPTPAGKNMGHTTHGRTVTGAYAAKSKKSLTFSAAKGNVTQTGNATGLGVRVLNGDITSGNAVMVGVTSVTGVKVGMIVDGTGLYFADDTRVTNIAGAGPYSVTMSNNALQTLTGQNINAYDSVRVKSGAEDKYYPITDASQRGWIAFLLSVNTSAAARIGDGPSTKVRAEMFERYLIEDSTPDMPAKTTMLIEELERAGGNFEVWATHGSEYFPVLPEPTVGSGYASSADIRLNGIQWSKTDQPEHVPEAFHELVGSGKHEIVALQATKDALFIFKTDGIWRLSGPGADAGWRIDPIDTTTVLLGPRCVTSLNGEVFAWTNRGVVRVGQYGVAAEGNISDAAIGKDLEAAENGLAKFSQATPGAFLTANERENELILGPATAGSKTSDPYVFNLKTGAWTKWAYTVTYMAYNPADSLLYAVATWHDKLVKERSGTDVDNADRDYSITISDVSGTTITINAGSGWTPAVGDAIYKASFMAVVKSVTSATVFDVDATGITTGSATAYDAIAPIIEFSAKTGRNPAARKHFMYSSAIFEDLKQTRRIVMEFTSDIDSTPDNEVRTLTRSEDSTQARAEYFTIPTDHAMVTQLYPRLEVNQAGAHWQFAGISLTYDVLSPLVDYSAEGSDLVAP